MTRPSQPLSRVLAAMKGVKRSGDGWLALCPAHDDRMPSLSINAGDDGRVLIKCHAGCETAAVVAEVGLTLADLFPSNGSNGNGAKSQVRAEYRYHDEHGAHVFTVVRLEPKGFRQRAASGAWSMEGVRRIPYRLPQLLAASRAGGLVFVVEGEKDADALVDLGLVATTNPGGAGKWRPEYSQYFVGAHVAVLPDGDDAGRAHAQDVAAKLISVAKTVRIVELPGLPPKGDVSDWLGQGGTADSLDQLVRAAPILTDPALAEIPPIDDDVPLAPAPTLDATALYGPIGDWVRLVAPHTEASLAALLACALAGIGALLGRGPHIRLDRARHGVNCNVLLIGPTSGGRKGTAFENVRHLMRALDIDFDAANITNGLSSGEGLIHAIRDAAEVPIGPKKKPDPGVADKRLLVVESEFSGVLRQLRRDGNILSVILREAWDGTRLRTLTKTSGETATDPHVAVIGMITPEELRRHLNETDVHNGFLNRFAMVWTERSRFLPFGGSPDVHEEQAVVTRLSQACARARVRGEVTAFTPDGRAWWSAHYPELAAGRPGRVGAALQRGAAQVRRIALLFAVLDDAPETDAAHLGAAYAFWQYVVATAEFVLGRSEFSARAQRLERALLEAGPAGMDRTTIRRTVFTSNNVPSRDIEAVLHELQSHGVARNRLDAKTDGRPREVWTHVRFSGVGAGKDRKNGN